MTMSMILGFLGTTISFILWLPQARSVWKSRKDAYALKAVSIGTQILVIMNASIWFLYAFALGEFWVGAAGFINLPLAVMTIFLLKRAKKKLQYDLSCINCGHSSKEPHLFFVTEPPGWGTVYPCPEDRTDLPRGVGVKEENLDALRVALEHG